MGTKVRRKTPRICVAVTQNEFEELCQRKIPSWRAFWNLLLTENSEMRGKTPSLPSKQVDLHRKIRNKISTLVKEEEMLVDLYARAAEAAKRREEEFKCKIGVLLQQIQKDKDLLKQFNGKG